MSEPLNPKLYEYGDLGLARVKEEGVAMPYDPLAGPGVPLTPWQRRVQRLRAVVQRIHDLPQRLKWALVGDDDSGW